MTSPSATLYCLPPVLTIAYLPSERLPLHKLRRTVRAGVPREWSGGCCLCPLAGPGRIQVGAANDTARRRPIRLSGPPRRGQTGPLPAAPHHASTSPGGRGPTRRPTPPCRGGTITGAVRTRSRPRSARASPRRPSSARDEHRARSNRRSGAAAAPRPAVDPVGAAAAAVSTGADASATALSVPRRLGVAVQTLAVGARRPVVSLDLGSAARPLLPRRRLQPRPGTTSACRTDSTATASTSAASTTADRPGSASASIATSPASATTWSSTMSPRRRAAVSVA